MNVFGFILITCLLTTGCGTILPENYKFGDGTKAAVKAASTIVSSKKAYCEETDPEARELLIKAIRLADPDYKGVCKD